MTKRSSVNENCENAHAAGIANVYKKFGFPGLILLKVTICVMVEFNRDQKEMAIFPQQTQ